MSKARISNIEQGNNDWLQELCFKRTKTLFFVYDVLKQFVKNEKTGKKNKQKNNQGNFTVDKIFTVYAVCL